MHKIDSLYRLDQLERVELTAALQKLTVFTYISTTPELILDLYSRTAHISVTNLVEMQILVAAETDLRSSGKLMAEKQWAEVLSVLGYASLSSLIGNEEKAVV